MRTRQADMPRGNKESRCGSPDKQVSLRRNRTTRHLQSINFRAWGSLSFRKIQGAELCSNFGIY
jgi:hypothetical protein